MLDPDDVWNTWKRLQFGRHGRATTCNQNDRANLLASRDRLINCPRATGHDTRALQAYLGHKNIQHTVRYTEMAPTRFKDLGAD